ncbi:hypothetical protein [Halolamina sp. C58]|uniref:hypothetical protein n=1 Tax=Halolamina sp. C58 TaxID=3421640 RepID=UPI003EC024FA
MAPRHAARASLDALRQRAVVVELAIVVTLLFGFVTGTVLLDAALDPFFLDSATSLLLVRNALALGWAGVLVASCAAWRGYPLPTSMPDRNDGRLVAAVVAATALLATLPFFYLAVRTGTGVDHVASTVADPGRVFTVRTLARIALFVPGMALLYHGLVQGALRHALGDERTLAVVATTLLGAYLAAPTVVTYGSFGNGPWLSIWGDRAAVAILFVLALGVGVYADERDGSPGVLPWLPVLLGLGLVAAVLVPDVGSPGGVLVVATRTAVIGVAAAAYDATESLAVPALVYAAFAAVSSVLYVATLAAAFGAG